MTKSRKRSVPNSSRGIKALVWKSHNERSAFRRFFKNKDKMFDLMKKEIDVSSF